MTEAKSISIRAVMMESLKTRFGGLSFWKEIESDVAMMCAGLVDPLNQEKTDELIKQLMDLREFIFGMDEVTGQDLTFIDEEIDRYRNTKTISLYEEEDDFLDPQIIANYARLGEGTEGIVGIHQKLNYSQLAKLTQGVYDKTGLVKFYISRERTLYGKVVAEIYEHSQEIPIAAIVESKKIDKETGDPVMKGVKIFGQKFSRAEYNVIREINVKFFVYRFITEDNNEMILITTSAIEIGDYVVTGVMTHCDDNKMLTDSARLPTKLPFFFAQQTQDRIIKFKDHEEFKSRLEFLKIKKDTFFDYPFTITKNHKTWKLLQPRWYKWLVWAWLTHQPKGIFNNYPMHLLIMGPKYSGKSLLLNSLHSRSKETRNIFSGSSSTLKHLVPSFKYNPARLGYLAESNRFAFCDEFLRCLVNTRTTKDGSQREESVAMMNDLLEHQKREAGSGISRVNVNMTSRIIATTNPIRDMKNVGDLIKSFDESFLSRWLIYYQTDDHVQIIRRSRDSTLDQYKFRIHINDWVSILDYLQTFSAEYDMARVEKIYASIPKILSEVLAKHYDARHMHHLECLMDGIVKARCLLEKDMTFQATEEDYKILKEVWSTIISSWLHADKIKAVDINERIFYLPENCQHIYWKMVELKRPISIDEARKIGEKAMQRRDFIDAWNILLDMDLLEESNGLARPHYIKEEE